MAIRKGISYKPGKTRVHRLTGASKLLMVLFASVAAMITYDTRFLLCVIALSFGLFAASKVPFRDVRVIVALIGFIMILNNIFIFLFSPEEGVAIYGTRSVITHLIGNYFITYEQLFYQFNVTIKYFTIMPLALIFFITTEPSEFASSLNKIGVNYKAAYSVSLTLRYIPAVMREYREISQAQQARGADISKDVRLPARLRGAASILFPLVITSIDKIETIANAMELRSFGKNKTRTWYNARRFETGDFVAVISGAALVLLSVALNIVNGGRFYNPFS